MVAVWTPPPAATASPAGGKLAADGIPARIGAGRVRPDLRFVSPVLRVETFEPLGQPVAIFGRPGTPGDALHELGVAAPHPGRFSRSERAAQHGVVWRQCRRRALRSLRWPLRRGLPCHLTPLLLLILLLLAFAVVRVFGARDRGVASEPLPVETQIRVSVFERLHHFGVERRAAELGV